MDIQDAIDSVYLELKDAMDKFRPFNSNHEGYAVILEEVDELWVEVKAHDPNFASPECRKEAIQVAAMALRFLIDRC